MALSRQLYSALVWAAQPLLRRKLRRRAQNEPGYGEAISERFGYYEPIHLGQDGRRSWVWVHAVSLGETRAAAILIRALRKQWPSMRLLLTHSTATGREAGKSLLEQNDLQVWLPWDTPGATQRFLRQFEPRLGVLMETEVWPNLLAQCDKLKIPVVLANARLNAKSLAGALRWRSLSMPAYRSLKAVWAQTPQDAERLCALHAPVQGVFGNLKFDVELPADQVALGKAWHDKLTKPVVLLASSREGEEAQWLNALLSMQANLCSAVQWLIVPRHPQRFDAVQALLEQSGFSVSRRSSWVDSPSLESDVWLGDSIGEMALYYTLSDIGLLGGSFEPLGGQNLIEAAAAGCPMLLGPHTYNFSQAADDACASGAALRVSDMHAAIGSAMSLLKDEAKLQMMRLKALQFAQMHRGAAKATAHAIAAICNHSAD